MRRLLIVFSFFLGVYYPPTSLKTALCIRGRDLLYSRCQSVTPAIPHRKTGKLIIATQESQVAYLQSLAEKAKVMREKGIGDVPLRWLSGKEVRELEPDVIDTVHGALLSSQTGIVGSHELMESLEKGQTGSRMRVSEISADARHDRDYGFRDWRDRVWLSNRQNRQGGAQKRRQARK